MSLRAAHEDICHLPSAWQHSGLPPDTGLCEGEMRGRVLLSILYISDPPPPPPGTAAEARSHLNEEMNDGAKARGGPGVWLEAPGKRRAETRGWLSLAEDEGKQSVYFEDAWHG